MITVNRIYQKDCTVGVLSYEGFRCFTLELPYLNNEPNISCIPEGLYKVKAITSPNLGRCLEISAVINRSLIRIHKGNYTRQIKGCLLVGDSLRDIDNDGIIDTTNSTSTLNRLLELVGDTETVIKIGGNTYG